MKESSTTSTISFSESNGSYSYTTGIYQGYSSSPYSSTVTVDGAAVPVAVTFTQITYTVTFTETGLPSGTEWYVNGTGVSGSSLAPSNITFSFVNETYTFTLTNLSLYYAGAHTISVTVDGKDSTESVTYYHWVYITGIVSQTDATLTINGKSISTSSGSFNVSVPNGTYHIVVTLSGYNSYYSNFTLSQGSVKNFAITLQPTSKPSPISSTELYAIIGVVVAVVVIASAVALSRKRK